MKTTLDLPDDLLQRAERVAVARGVTLEILVGTALVREVEAASAPKPGKRRVSFPIFPSQQPGRLELTGKDIASAVV